VVESEGEIDSLKGVGYVAGGAGDDTLTAIAEQWDTGPDQLTGGTGSDRILAGHVLTLTLPKR
jgi:Ca2+-binding RTX toxin-like protein